ncbi:hypothetical protein NUW58_g6894 [Xylaria curta]|uniref:Uncharacterized protein n=1 Tax=Xylaria curta TaxID=42375 RepID=A0ACC1NMY8_9PEZI|nr:hypothetical protein NUW58_g6894 [Xylaria curta]
MQRRNITGFNQKRPIVIYGSLKETIHGTSAAGEPHSLIIVCWRIQQRSPKRRLKWVRIRAVFQTTRASLGGNIDASYDPIVVSIAPQGTYSMFETPVAQTRDHSIEGGFEAGIDSIQGMAKVIHRKSQSFEKVDCITINGFERNVYNQQTADGLGDPDRCNAVEWQLFENSTVGSGLPTSFCTAVLLKRHQKDESPFTGTFTVRMKINHLTDAWIAVKRLIGIIPCDNPVIFNPAVDEPGTLAAFKGNLDDVALLDFCQFEMSKSGVGM